MQTKKIVNLCQLALRAGKAESGDALLKTITTGKAKAVVMDDSMGANMKKKILDKCKTYEVPVVPLESEAFASISRRPIKALALTDSGFVSALTKEVKG